MQTNFFSLLAPLLPEGGSLAISLTRKGDHVSITILPRSEKSNNKLTSTPIILSATAAELDAVLFEKITEPLTSAKGVIDNIAQYTEDAAKAAEASEKKTTPKASKKAAKPAAKKKAESKKKPEAKKPLSALKEKAKTLAGEIAGKTTKGAIKITPEEHLTNLLSEADAMFRKKDYAETVKTYEAALLVAPEDRKPDIEKRLRSARMFAGNVQTSILDAIEQPQ